MEPIFQKLDIDTIRLGWFFLFHCLGTTHNSFPKSKRISNSRQEKRLGHPLRGNLVPIIGVGVAFGQVLRQFLGWFKSMQ